MDEPAIKKVKSLMVTVRYEYTPRDNGTKCTGSKTLRTVAFTLILSNTGIVSAKDLLG